MNSQHRDLDVKPLLKRTKIHDQPIVIENEHSVSLFFDACGIQSRMFLHDPYVLALGYTRTMMGFLLFHPHPARVSIIGLGGGSLAKYCYRYLPATNIVAVEINPAIIALRNHFHVPQDDERFTVVCANAAHYIRRGNHQPDVLLLDGYDAGGIPRDLMSRTFYEACHRRLSANGVLVLNLITDAPTFRTCLQTLKDVFQDAVTLAPATDSPFNIIAFAWKGEHAIPPLSDMLSRAADLEATHAVDLHAAATCIEYGKKFDWKQLRMHDSSGES
jgi:spermidine synthase